MLILLVEPAVLLSDLCKCVTERIDPRQTLVQQQFETEDSALPIFQLAVQQADLGPQMIDLST